MATHRSVNPGPDPRIQTCRQLRRYERDLRIQLAVSQVASFFHLLCSELKVGWFSRSVILTWVAVRRHWTARRANRKPAR